jgi:glycosyltransferase involved in cell wall biosynthesis
MTSPPDVSVVIPTKNRWPILSRAALPSALGQEGVEVEIVVVDDGSTDETTEELERLALSDGRVRLVRHDRSRGVSAARNSGLEVARAPLVAFLDDDDVWSPLKLARQTAVLQRERSAFVYAGAVAIDEHGRVLYEYYFPDPANLARQLLESAVIPAGASNVVARAELVREVGGFDESLPPLEDWDLWIRLTDAGRPSALAEVLVAVLYHPANAHANAEQARLLDRLVRKHAALSPPRILDVDRLGHARWVASEHSRAGAHRRAAGLYLRTAIEHRTPTDLLRAADAALGKRLSRIVLKSRRQEAAQATVVPGWLQGHQSFDGLTT